MVASGMNRSMPLSCWSETIPMTVNCAGPAAVESSTRSPTWVVVARAMFCSTTTTRAGVR